MKAKKLVYRPSRLIIFTDLTIVLTLLLVTLLFAPLTHPHPLEKYGTVSLIFVVCWVVFSYLLRRYRPIRKIKYFKTTIQLLTTAVGVTLCMVIVDLLFPHNNYSVTVFLFVSLNCFLMNMGLLVFNLSVRYAVEYADPVIIKPQEIQLSKAIVETDTPADASLYAYISTLCGNKVADWVINHTPSGNRTMRFLTNSEYEKLHKTPNNREYNHIFMLDSLNTINGLNLLFYCVNQHLSTGNGVFTCCFETKSTRKLRILNHHPLLTRWLVYFYDFVIQRFLPKLLLERRLYFKRIKIDYRILPKTEVLGRLCYMGFSIVAIRKMNGLCYVTARKQHHLTAIPPLRVYGPLIKLRRSGKHGKPIIVYKFRTMYAFSEFLQEYIYNTYQLQEGGKFTKDIRVSSWGRFMRRYFLDELPMLWNIVKGEMKLVGVRPLSAQYLSLYSAEVLKLRQHDKPGLLPPFYADMPTTIDEIQQSELRYLQSCKAKGVWRTDSRYFVKIMYNLFFNNAKSA